MTPAERLLQTGSFDELRSEIARLTAENERLREQIGGYPSVDDLRMAMVLCADENERLREAFAKHAYHSMDCEQHCWGEQYKCSCGFTKAKRAALRGSEA